ncbi:MAG: DUF4349 domain-containing protein [Gemmatimonadota bacterium]|nr:DUF4349 domain-containing protein [Gemmatimonadota bacterium]
MRLAAMTGLFLLACPLASACKGPDGGQPVGNESGSKGMAVSVGRPEAVSMVQAPAAPPSGRLAKDEAAPAGGGEQPLLTPGAAGAGETLAPSMIIRTGQASIQVDSLELGVARVRLVATQLGGYIANASLQAGHDQLRSATLEIKLPAARFDELVNRGLPSIGKVETVNQRADDVGEEFVDVAVRVENKKREEQRLIQLLATRTGKLSDVVLIEEKLAEVREAIERMEGRMRYLKTRSAISTFSVTVHESIPVVGQKGTTSVLAAAFVQAWRNFIGFLANLIASLGVLLPLGVLIAFVLWLAMRYRRRHIPPDAARSSRADTPPSAGAV